MGQVWVARNESMGADVAVKVLLPERAASKDALERFRREANATAQLTHRGIIRVFDVVELDEEQGSLLMVMELLRGHTLAAKIHQQVRLGVEETLEILLPILSALEHAHGVGFVHRDLKPENIFLAIEPDGQVLPKLLDFGISKMRQPSVHAITGDGELVGTPCYMSPEQATGRGNVDPRSDVFSAGILLYEMLSGRSPFTGDGVHEVVVAILEKEAEPILDIPPSLWEVVARALRKKPGERFATAAELALALRAAVPSYTGRSSGPIARPITATVPPVVTQAEVEAAAPQAKSPRRTRTQVAAGAALVAVIVAGAAVGNARHVRAAGVTTREAPIAVRAAKQVVDVDRLVESGAIADARRAPLLFASATAMPVPTTPMTAAAGPIVPTVTATPQPLLRRRARVVLARDPGF